MLAAGCAGTGSHICRDLSAQACMTQAFWCSVHTPCNVPRGVQTCNVTSGAQHAMYNVHHYGRHAGLEPAGARHTAARVLLCRVRPAGEAGPRNQPTRMLHGACCMLHGALRMLYTVVADCSFCCTLHAVNLVASYLACRMHVARCTLLQIGFARSVGCETPSAAQIVYEQVALPSSAFACCAVRAQA